MMDRVAGNCPMGCGETLFLGLEGHVTCGETLFLGLEGHVTCSLDRCPNPCAVDDLLHDRDAHLHVVTFGEASFDIQHPLAERGEDLVECGLHQHIRLLDGPPVAPGKYTAHHDGNRWIWQQRPITGVTEP